MSKMEVRSIKWIKKKQLRKDIRTVVIVCIAAVIIYGVMNYYFGTSSPHLIVLFKNVAKYGVLALIAYYLIRHSTYSLKKIFGSFSLKNVNWLHLALLNLLLSSLGLPTVAAMTKIGNVSSSSLVTNFLQTPSETLGFLPNSILAIAVAPIVEEVLFRGYLLNRFGKKKSGTMALVLSSAVFSLIQSNGVVIPQFVTGLFFGMTYMKTRKLIVPILLHVMKNVTDLFLAQTLGKDLLPIATTNLARLEPYLSQQTLIFIIAAPICGYLLYRYYKKSPRKVPLYARLKF